MNKSEIRNMDIPLYIVDVENDFSGYHCFPINQIDIFPTLLCYMGINSGWRGVGQDIFSIDYKIKNNLEKEKDLSSKIVRSDYFRDILISK